MVPIDRRDRKPRLGESWTAVLALGLLMSGCRAHGAAGASSAAASSAAAESEAQPGCSAHAALLCGPWLTVDVQARGGADESRALEVTLALSEGGYFADLDEDGPQAHATVEQVRAHPAVALSAPSVRVSPDSAQRATVHVPFELDVAACRTGCNVDLWIRTMVCREPGMCHEVQRPVHVDLHTTSSSPSELELSFR